MSENIPVISIPVDNSGLQEAVSLFEKLTQYAEKYKRYGNPSQGLPPPPPAGGGTPPPAGSAGGEGDGGGAGAGGGGGGGGFLSRLNRFAKGVDKAFGEAGKTLGKVTGQLKKLFELSLGWAVKFAMLATGSAFGYDIMAKRTTQQLMGAQGNRMTVGQDNAARNIYGNRFSGYQGTIEALRKAQQDGTSTEAIALRGLGIDPSRGAGENLPLVYERLAPMLSNYKDSGMGYAYLRAHKFDSLIGGEADVNQIQANAADIPGLSRDYKEQSQKLDLPDSVSRSSQRLTTTFANNLDQIINAFKTSMSTLDGPIERLSIRFTEAVTAFLSGKNGKDVFNYIADGINTFGDWLNSDDFKTDMEGFSKGLADGAKIVSSFVKSLSDLKGWIDNLTGAAKDKKDPLSISNVGNVIGDAGESSGKWTKEFLQKKFGWELDWWSFPNEVDQQKKEDVPVQKGQAAKKKVNLSRDYAKLNALVDDPNARSFLDLISKSEGTYNTPGGGYNTMYGGGQFAGQDHPRVRHPFKQTDGTWNVTTAAGRYQFLGKTWDDSAEKLGLPDFSPRNQDIAALHRIEARGQLDNVLSGDFDKAVAGLGGEWASLPSSKYSQPKHDMATIRGMYNNRSVTTQQRVMVEVKQAPGADYVAQVHANMPPPLVIPQ
ncbi:glycoside hydrolase family 24 protein [Serratia fonticola]|uniref:Glycoside hydrolase family 104 protein n=1 Tax=Serratia fonticola TaxID=47917 RepID=A0AAE7EHE8_SERFO|nr:glycoside hydrolase family 104 protein [Serratia fonticola]QKJ58795.1 glycoside hydrolase family 104 protein [Serratia fonticola]